MHAPVQRHSASRRTLFARLFVVISFTCLISVFPLIYSSAAAQDYGHMRVQFGHGAAWADTAPRPAQRAAAARSVPRRLRLRP